MLDSLVKISIKRQMLIEPVSINTIQLIITNAGYKFHILGASS